MRPLSAEDIAKLAAEIVPYLERYGSASERDLTMGGDAYKPFYRACSCLLAGRRDNTVPATVLGLDRMVTLEEAKAVLSAAHPFFEDAIEREPDHFAATFQFHVEAWEDQYEDD